MSVARDPSAWLARLTKHHCCKSTCRGIFVFFYLGWLFLSRLSRLFPGRQSKYCITCSWFNLRSVDSFTAIDEGAQTTAAIAKRCAASERGIRILCDYLTTLADRSIRHFGGVSSSGPNSALSFVASWNLMRAST